MIKLVFCIICIVIICIPICIIFYRMFKEQNRVVRKMLARIKEKIDKLDEKGEF